MRLWLMVMLVACDAGTPAPKKQPPPPHQPNQRVRETTTDVTINVLTWDGRDDSTVHINPYGHVTRNVLVTREGTHDAGDVDPVVVEELIHQLDDAGFSESARLDKPFACEGGTVAVGEWVVTISHDSVRYPQLCTGDRNLDRQLAIVRKIRDLAGS